LTEVDVAVIGAGVIGVTAAYHLRRAGLSVALIERHAEAGSETSFANGGLITPSMADPWASPGLPLQMLRWIGREDSPFLLRPRALPSLGRWGYRFVRNCTVERWHANTRRILQLAQLSQRSLADVMREERIECGFSSRGSLRVFNDAASMDKAMRTAELMRQLGVEWRALDERQCIELEPALAPLAGSLHGAIYYPQDEAGDCNQFTVQLAAVCTRLGVVTAHNTDVERIEPRARPRRFELRTNHGPMLADNVVIATADAPAHLIGRHLAGKLLTYRVKGYSVTLSAEGLATAPRIPLIDDARKVGISRFGDRLRAVGTAEFCGNDARVTPRRIDYLLNNATALLPSLKQCRVLHRWAGLRPMTPDGAPYIAALPQPGLFASIGHGHLGWTNACGSAVLIRDLVCGAKPQLDLAQYAPR
jgi:D-amino-acid dehydrogenase